MLESGLKVQSEWTTTLVARQPDRLLTDATSDVQDRWYFYDGKQFTLWATRVDFYATVPAPPTIAELARTLEENYGIEVPLVDLFRWGTEADASAAITAAIDLGPGTVGDTTCEHYAFRQEGLDWQVWIQEGDFPLPRKVVLTTTTDEARPQFEATYTWNLAPSFNDAAFTFDPPADAHRIVSSPPIAPARRREASRRDAMNRTSKVVFALTVALLVAGAPVPAAQRGGSANVRSSSTTQSVNRNTNVNATTTSTATTQPSTPTSTATQRTQPTPTST